MNTNRLKRFAQEARKKLIEQVGAKLEYVLSTDTAELREKAEQVKGLKEELSRSTKEQLTEKVAYTWFNRLVALRFMDVNGYQPLDIRVVSPKEGYTFPELLDEAKQGHITEELKVNTQYVYDLLDGRLPSTNPQYEAYKVLLIAACNHLYRVLPFLFERINDYTDLLLPDDLTSEFSIVHDVREGMADDDCQQVEIIGWLYQFYISEENDRLISSKKAYKKHELAPASQLFTPKWIVQYMVDNTLGQLWAEINPSTSITTRLEFYIKPAYKELLHPQANKSIEDIKFFDPCVGSAHILAYAFDVFYMIYEEQGYSLNEIPEFIITKNLYGTDIDERAGQIAYFVLMMKGRQYNRRFLRKNIVPNIAYYQDYSNDSKFQNASAIGSLIRVEPDEVNNIRVEEDSLFGYKQKELKKLYSLLGQRYDIVATNPPYISSSRMEYTLRQFVESNYPETKSDLFACFLTRLPELAKNDGMIGFICPYVWMFISSYEWLRKNINKKTTIQNLIQLEYNAFEPACVPICTFTLRNNSVDMVGKYIKLSEFRGYDMQPIKTLEAIHNPQCGWMFNSEQKDFSRIPGYRFGYWMNQTQIEIFEREEPLSKKYPPKTGLSTTNNDRGCCTTLV